MPRCRVAIGVVFGLPLVGLLAPGCAEMKQNLRGQELSYRGAWYCESSGCKDVEMRRSMTGTRDGEVRVSHVLLKPRVGLVFSLVNQPDSITAKVADCAGHETEVGKAQIYAPGNHQIDGEGGSWVVFVNRRKLDGLQLDPAGKCARWTVTTTATWSDGATYTATTGLQIER